MKNSNKGGRGMPKGQRDVCLIKQNRLLRFTRKDETGRNDERTTNRNDEMWRSDVLLMIFCVLFSGLLVSPAFGQEADGLNKVQPLTIGSKVPNEFWTHQHLFYINGDTVRQSLEEHKGKLLVLDFWMSGCTTCLRHQKEINVFKKSFADKLAVVMVNSKKTKENFEKIDWAVRSDRYKQLDIDHLESIIEDTYLERLFPYHCFPSYFWINENGVLQTHTFRNLLDNGYQAPYIEK